MSDRERSAFLATLTEGATALSLRLNDTECASLWRHFQLLLEANTRINLTRIIDPVQAAAKLYADALAPLAWMRDSGVGLGQVVDIGTGAGFPSIPFALVGQECQVTAVDSTGKKIAFVADCAAQLAIGNLATEQARAGQWCAPRMYDAALFKAVGPLARCLEFARGLIARNGCVIVLKGPGLGRAELDAGQAAAEAQNLQTWDCVDYDLPCGDETLQHTLVIYRRL
jgi:16S rRNA (guanine527-N7)-methyltransferase